MSIYDKLFFGGAVRAPEGGAGAPAGDPPAAPPPGSPPAAPAAPATDSDWFAKLTGDPEMKTWAESKGWKDPASTDPLAIAQSYYNLEKLFGADKAGRTIHLPKDESDKAAFDAIYDRLGRPKDPSGYQIDLPEGANKDLIDAARNWYHKAGLSANQAKAVTESYRAMELDLQAKRDNAMAQEVEALKQEWGAQFDQRVETGKAATKAAGMTEEHVKAIETVLGPASAAKMFEFFGRNYVEAGPPGNESRSDPNFRSITPAAAQQKIQELRADKNFMERYQSPDPKVRMAAIEEMDRLAQLAVNAKA